MSFIDHNFDLSGTYFTADNLAFARDHLAGLFSSLAPGWIENPVGEIGERWQSHHPYNAWFLINLSLMISALQRHTSGKSAATLDLKIKQLLKELDEDRFEEAFIEIEVGDYLAKGPPIEFSPLVPEFLDDPGLTPPSPDFSIEISGETLLVEATVFRFGPMERFARRLRQETQFLHSACANRRLAREIRISLPLEFPNFDRHLREAILGQFRAKDSGSVAFRIAETTGKIEWKSIPRIATEGDGPVGQHGLDDGGAVYPVSVNQHVVHAVYVYPHCTSPDLNDLLLKSFRKKLRHKRDQNTSTLPYLLALKLNNAYRLDDALHELITKRIFKNRSFRWLSAIGLIKPNRLFTTGSEPTKLLLTVNPLASYPLPAFFSPRP